MESNHEKTVLSMYVLLFIHVQQGQQIKKYLTLNNAVCKVVPTDVKVARL